MTPEHCRGVPHEECGTMHDGKLKDGGCSELASLGWRLVTRWTMAPNDGRSYHPPLPPVSRSPPSSNEHFTMQIVISRLAPVSPRPWGSHSLQLQLSRQRKVIKFTASAQLRPRNMMLQCYKVFLHTCGAQSPEPTLAIPDFWGHLLTGGRLILLRTDGGSMPV